MISEVTVMFVWTVLISSVTKGTFKVILVQFNSYNLWCRVGPNYTSPKISQNFLSHSYSDFFDADLPPPPLKLLFKVMNEE